MNFKIILLTGIAFFILSGCVSSLYMPTENDAKASNTSLDTLKMSRKLYVKKCSSCHNLYLPSKYTSQEWTAILEKMQERAKIDNSQKESIIKYLEVNNKK